MLGYTVPKLLGNPEEVARTVSIETGMQNSALGVVLASRNFADPLTALPCAISATCHSVLGSSFAVTAAPTHAAASLQNRCISHVLCGEATDAKSGAPAGILEAQGPKQRLSRLFCPRLRPSITQGMLGYALVNLTVLRQSREQSSLFRSFR